MIQYSGRGLPVFIVGCYRSGTTLLRAMLCAHSMIAIPEETRFFWDLRESGAVNYDHLASVLGKDVVSECQSNAARIGQEPKAIFDFLLSRYAAKQGKPFWGEKSPRHALCIREIRESYPAATVIYMVRDPRAVFESALRWSRKYEEPPALWMSSDAQFVAGNWRTRLEAALSADNGVRFVRYEDLVRNPHGVIRKILGDLNLSFEMSTVAAKCLDGTNVAGLVDREWHRLALEEVSTKHLDKWGSALSIDNVRTIERECGELMRRFGYQPGAYDG